MKWVDIIKQQFQVAKAILNKSEVPYNLYVGTGKSSSIPCLFAWAVATAAVGQDHC